MGHTIRAVRRKGLPTGKWEPGLGVASGRGGAQGAGRGREGVEDAGAGRPQRTLLGQRQPFAQRGEHPPSLPLLPMDSSPITLSPTFIERLLCAWSCARGRVASRRGGRWSPVVWLKTGLDWEDRLGGGAPGICRAQRPGEKAGHAAFQRDPPSRGAGLAWGRPDPRFLFPSSRLALCPALLTDKPGVPRAG